MTRSIDGFTLVELLVAVAVVGIIASVGLVHASGDRYRLQLDAAARRLQLGLERGRSVARREQQACGIALDPEGWLPPAEEVLPGELLACPGVGLALQEAFAEASIALHTNLPAVVRVAANGLLLDGGTVVLRHPRVARSRCLVVSLPLGISRIGSYREDLASGGAALSSSRCRPDPQDG